MKGGFINAFARMLRASMPVIVNLDRFPVWKDLTKDNCGSAGNGGKRNCVAREKRAVAKKARFRAAQRRKS